jgi:hypothetical protein
MSSKKNFEGLHPRECHQKRILKVYNPVNVIKKEIWRLTTPWMSSKKNFGGLQPLGRLQKKYLEVYNPLESSKKEI